MTLQEFMNELHMLAKSHPETLTRELLIVRIGDDTEYFDVSSVMTENVPNVPGVDVGCPMITLT